MNSQCGSFKFRGRKIRGCMLTCSDALCNGAPGTVSRLFNAGFYTGLTGLIPYNSMLMEILLGIRVCIKLFHFLIYCAYFISSLNKKINNINYLYLISNQLMISSLQWFHCYSLAPTFSLVRLIGVGGGMNKQFRSIYMLEDNNGFKSGRLKTKEYNTRLLL